MRNKVLWRVIVSRDHLPFTTNKISILKSFSTSNTNKLSNAASNDGQSSVKTKAPNEDKKPLVLLFPFLGAPSAVVQKYASMYENNGCNVLSFPIELKEFLWPKSGLKNSHLLLDKLEKRVAVSNEQIIVHSMSIGCYFYALMMCNMNENPDKFANIRSNIVGQVVDSPVVGTLNEMAIGVSKMVTSAATARSLFYSLCRFYFMVTKPYTVNYFNKAIEVFKNHSPIAPSVILKADHDEMALPEAFHDLVECWSAKNDNVTFKILNNSYHIGLFKTHPEEYQSMVKELVANVKLKSLLKSKL